MKKARILEIIILIILFIGAISGLLVYRYEKYEKPNTYNIIFKDIDSIVKGSPVRFMGMNIGYVVRLKRHDGRILCRIRVTKRGVKIPDNTKAKVAFNGLAGSKSIELFPPDTNDDGIFGIVAEDSLRISDFVKVVYDLKDVCTIINNFVQNFDTKNLSKDLKEVTDPKAIQEAGDNIERVLDKYEKTTPAIKNTAKNEKTFSDYIDKINNIFKK